MYAGLLDGRLDQANAVLNVKSCIARDVRLQEMENMINKLSTWQGLIRNLTRGVEADVVYVAKVRMLQVEAQSRVHEAIKSAKAMINSEDPRHAHLSEELSGRGVGRPALRPKRDRSSKQRH